MAQKKLVALAATIALSLGCLMLAMLIQCVSISVNTDVLFSLSIKPPNFALFTPIQWCIQVIYFLLAAFLPPLFSIGEAFLEE